MRKCPKCGYMVENDKAKFCRKCGTRLPDDATGPGTPAGNTMNNPGVTPPPPPRKEKTPPSSDGITLGVQGLPNPEYHDPEPLSGSGSGFSKTEYTGPRPESGGMWWAVKRCFSKYATFKGRASRSEYWYFYLFNFLLSLVLVVAAFIVVDKDPVSSILMLGLLLYDLVAFLPNLAVTIRRLHDIGKSGWMICVNFVPIIGSFIVLYFLCKKGDDYPNAYGVA